MFYKRNSTRTRVYGSELHRQLNRIESDCSTKSLLLCRRRISIFPGGLLIFISSNTINQSSVILRLLTSLYNIYFSLYASRNPDWLRTKIFLKTTFHFD